jgi:YVTN family beta-propeller protein
VLVTDETGGNIVVVDAASGEVRDRIPVGKRPRGIHVSPDRTLVYVALSGSAIGGPNVDESKLPPPDRSADGIGVVDLKTRTLVRLIPSGPDPESFDVSPDGKTAFVSNEDAAEMTVLDLTTGTILKRVKVGEEPEGVRMRPDGKVVYITCEGADEVFAVDTASYAVLAKMKTGGRPRSIEFTRDGLWAFSSDENGASVSVIDAVAHKVVQAIPMPKPDMPAPVASAAGAREGGPPRAAQALPMGLVLAPSGNEL